MLYRLFQPDDFEDLYAIEEVCFESPQRFTRAYMRRLITSPNSAAWIADQDGKVAGFAIVEFIRDVGPTVAYIATIEVLPNLRGQGTGAELLRHIEGSAKEVHASGIWLHVDIENSAAIRLYERMGFRNSGRADNFYARSRPASIYVKSLAP